MSNEGLGTVLQLSDVVQYYGQGETQLNVLKGVNLDVRSGEMVALVAPSGAGKSTLLHIAGLLEKPKQGEIYIANQPCTQLNDAQRSRMRRREIGFIYQFHHLLADFNAIENLIIPQLMYGYSRSEAKSRAMQVLQYMRIDHRATHRPSELSGGEQQRVAIARAVVNAPSLLLADEPTGNLDPETSDYIFQALRKLLTVSKLGAIVATHNHQLASRMDRRFTIEHGQLVEV